MTIPHGVDYICLEIPRVDVEKSDLTTALNVLRSTIEDKNQVQRFKGRVSLFFQGYDDDSRELYEIEDCRTFMQNLTKEFPYWFYIIDKSDNNLKLIMMLLCRYSKTAPEHVHLHPGDMEEVMLNLFSSMNRLFEKFDLDQKENEALSQEITSSFFKFNSL